MSSLAVKNPPVARTKPCPVKNLVKNPAQKTNPVRIFVDGAVPFYRAAKNLQVFAILYDDQMKALKTILTSYQLSSLK
jgi:hypothetical protein